MASDRVNVYGPCDKAIKSMNRVNVELFGRLKLVKWDEVHIIQTVVQVYTESYQEAKKRYYEVAFEGYLLALALCGEVAVKAHRMAEKAITEEWVEKVLTEPDPVTLYRFEEETERKAYRLAEALEVAPDKNREIDKALRFWSQQTGQYAINVTDYAMMEAFEDAGIQKVRWISEHDNRVCGVCHTYDGNVYELDEVPIKPHWGCRCHLEPVK